MGRTEDGYVGVLDWPPVPRLRHVNRQDMEGMKMEYAAIALFLILACIAIWRL
jgi:hypothetical protein